MGNINNILEIEIPQRLAPVPAAQFKKVRRGAIRPQTYRRPRGSNACKECRNKKTKCDENTPKCNRCKENGLQCVYIPVEQRYSFILRKKIQHLRNSIKKRNSILDYLRGCSVQHLARVMHIIRRTALVEDILFFIDNEDKKQISIKPMHSISPISDDDIAGSPVSHVSPYDMAGTIANDIPRVNGNAKPWTTVTDSNELVSHLISMVIRWDQCNYKIMEIAPFLEDMASGNTLYCSSILVNAILALGCRLSRYNLMRKESFDPNCMRYRFLTEAMKQWHMESLAPCLTTVQAGIFLAMAAGGKEIDDISYMLISRVIYMSIELGFPDMVVEASVPVKTTETATANMTTPQHRLRNAMQVTAKGVWQLSIYITGANSSAAWSSEKSTEI